MNIRKGTTFTDKTYFVVIMPEIPIQGILKFKSKIYESCAQQKEFIQHYANEKKY